jgi:cobalt/nickel transport system permease protein
MSGYRLLSLEGAAPWLLCRDPRLRIVTAAMFALTTATLTRPLVALVALALALAIAWAAGFSPAALAQRLVAFESFMLLLLAMLPFTVPGEALWTFGTLAFSREGLFEALTIMAKASAIVVALTTLIGTLEPVTLGHALARLGVPDKLAHLFLFTVRYLAVLHEEYQGLRQSLRVRAFKPGPNRHTWRTFGWLVGMLLVRSLERSRRIHAAMRCRGFKGKLHLIHSSAWQTADSVALVVGVILLGVLPVLDRLA